MPPANRSLDDGFPGLIPQTDHQVRNAMVGGLLSLDANVLLNFYRYGPTGQEALLDVLRAAGDRVWVSHQAAREFWRNRSTEIDDRNKAIDEVTKALTKNKNSALESISNWAKQRAIPKEIENRVRERITTGFADASQLIEDEAAQAPRVSYDTATDSVVSVLRELLDGKVGPPLSHEEHRQAVEEANRRIKEETPPGYQDAEKDPDRAAGDYLVWHQSVLEAKRRDLPLAIVTADEKEDWWWRHRGVFMGPRRELIEEFAGHSQHPLMLIRPTQLINHASVLNITVSEEAAYDVERGNTPLTPRWNANAVHELLRRLDAEGAIQADVIRYAASQGGLIDREKIYEIADYPEDRMLRGFTRPTARITRDLQNEGLLDDGVEPMLAPIYQDVAAIRFEIPLDVVEILAVDDNTAK